jgi:hypothetical protein
LRSDQIDGDQLPLEQIEHRMVDRPRADFCGTEFGPYRNHCELRCIDGMFDLK